MVIRDFREHYLFVALASLLVILVLILSKLATSIGAKTVQVSAICQRHCMSLATGDRHNLLVAEGLNARRIRLVRLVLSILG